MEELRTDTKASLPVALSDLTCAIELLPAGGGEFALTFVLANHGDEPVTLEYMEPFLDFELRAFAQDGEVGIVQPIYDTGIAPATLTIAAGESARLPTPIRIRFGPVPESAAGEKPTTWTLDHAPVTVRLEARITLGELSIGPCQTHLEPPLQPDSVGTPESHGRSTLAE
jgi:hypothetical protein